jgi:hypothetical protein
MSRHKDRKTDLALMNRHKDRKTDLALMNRHKDRKTDLALIDGTLTSGCILGIRPNVSPN